MRPIVWMHKIFYRQQGQSMVEAAFAIPILLLLFAGCVQLVQIGVAHIVVRVAAYEAARQTYLASGNLANGRQVAMEICRTLSPGQTEYTLGQRGYQVTHHLQAIFPVIKNVEITYSCPGFVFQAGENSEDDP
jgi:Flp pilus assembly protein TadG